MKIALLNHADFLNVLKRDGLEEYLHSEQVTYIVDVVPPTNPRILEMQGSLSKMTVPELNQIYFVDSTGFPANLNVYRIYDDN